MRRVLLPLSTAALLLIASRVLAWGSSGPLAATQAGAATFDELVGLLAAFLAWVVLGWTVLVLAATALAGIPGAIGRTSHVLAAALTPVAARRLARIAVGMAVAAGPVATAVPAAAWPGATSVSATRPAPADGDVAALPAESLPGVGRPAPEPVTPVPWVPEIPQPAPDESRDDAEVVVEPGDCLWDIAAERLGADATVAGIAADWPRWYQANRDVVGDDPDLLLPGMVLRVPAEH